MLIDIRTWQELLTQLAYQRHAKHLSQSVVAKKLNTTNSAISRLENYSISNSHSPTLETLSKYAEATGHRITFNIEERG